jgi:tetratricopeptide (TPR) repeat protein
MMNQYKKRIVITLAAVATLAIIFVGVRFYLNESYVGQLPPMPDLHSFSEPIRQQLLFAEKKVADHPTTENTGKLGMAYHSCAQYEQARKCYELAVKNKPSEWVWSYYLGYLDQEMGDSKGAIENFKAVLKQNPNVTAAWYYLGEAYQNMRQSNEAEDAFNHIKDASVPNTKEKLVRVNFSTFPVAAKFELSRIYLNTNRLDEAEKLLKGIISVNHTIGPVYRLLGNVYAAKGDSVLSKKFITRASDLAEVTTLNDTLVDKLSLMSRSELYLPRQIDDAMKSANPEWAQQLFDHALPYLSDDKYMISKAIKFYLRTNNGKKALPLLDQNRKNFGDEPNEMIGVANLLYGNGFYREAIPYFAQSLKLKPESTDQVENYALSYFKMNQKDSALNVMNRLHTLHKNNPDVLASEVDFMLQSGDKNQARSFLAKLRQVAPTHAKAYKYSGIISEIDGNQKLAEQDYENSFRSDPGDLEVIQKLGDLLVNQREWGKSISLFRRALKAHPNDSHVLERLATLLISCPDSTLHNIPEGLDYAERTFYHISSSLNTLIAAGKDLTLGYAMLGDYHKAASFIRITIQIAKSQKVSPHFMNTLLQLQQHITASAS